MTKLNSIISATWLEQQQRRLRAVIASKLGADDSHALDDIWQELLVTVEKNTNPESIKTPDAWIRQVINHKVADYLRSKQRSQKLKDHLAENIEPPTPPQPFDWVLALEDRQQVIDALTKCHPENRQILKLKYFSEATVNKIATTLNITAKAAEYRLHRAREEFRKIITTLREKS
ncbi:MAG: RNA polymerase sigma factor [Akkermansiaceae bacterium]